MSKISRLVVTVHEDGSRFVSVKWTSVKSGYDRDALRRWAWALKARTRALKEHDLKLELFY